MAGKQRQIDQLFRDARRWRQEADALREVLLETDLAEEVKWGKPCYSVDGRNICIIQRMTGYLALLFFKGALLQDPDGILEVQGPNSRAGYRMRFTGVDDVEKHAGSIKAYVREAIDNEKAGLRVEKAPEADIPAELAQQFDADPAFKAAFEGLTPGRQRGYVLHFSGAKQSKTRAARIDKARDRILAGKGMHDR